MGQPELSYLDLESFQKDFVSPDRPLQMKFYVDGIKCSRCVQKLEALENSLPEVLSLRVNLATREMAVEMKPGCFGFSQVAEAAQKIGFHLEPIQTKKDLQAHLESEDKVELRRIGVAAVCASNIMMFAIANYVGAAGDFKIFFDVLSLILYFPILLYSAVPFYKGFFASVQRRQLSIDGPLTGASIGGFLFSTVNLLRGQGSVYFDSLAGFLFLILLSRYFQKKLQRRYLNFRNGFGHAFHDRVRKKLSSGEWVWQKSDQLKSGDTIVVRQNEVVPADGVLTSAQANVDSSFLTGESRALARFQGSEIQAGVILLSDHAEVRVTAVDGETLFGKLLTQLSEGISKKTQIQSVSDRWSKILLTTVFSVAGVLILALWPSSPEQAIERALALIILACPCAMAFGTPLAISFGIKKAFENGFLIRDGDVFDKIANIKNVAFDKTGTLTGRNLKIVNLQVVDCHPEMAGIVLGLENRSLHPIAEALRQHYLISGVQPVVLDNLHEELGRGVAGQFRGHRYSIRSSQSLTGRKTVGLFQEDRPLAHFEFADPLLAEAKELFRRLKNRGLELKILSGDHVEEVEKIRQELGLAHGACHSELTPQGKAEILKSLPNTMMVGDGFNDSLALQKSSLGLAVRTSVQMALESSDVCLLSDDISKIDSLFDIANKTRRVVKRNLTISLVYNVVAGTAAVMGFINPMIAAILMPISSGFILFSSWMGSRK